MIVYTNVENHLFSSLLIENYYYWIAVSCLQIFYAEGATQRTTRTTSTSTITARPTSSLNTNRFPPPAADGDSTYGVRDMALAALAGCLCSLALAAVVVGAIATRRPSASVGVISDSSTPANPKPDTNNTRNSDSASRNPDEPLSPATGPAAGVEQSSDTSHSEVTSTAVITESSSSPTETMTMNQEAVTLDHGNTTTSDIEEIKEENSSALNVHIAANAVPEPIKLTAVLDTKSDNPN